MENGNTYNLESFCPTLTWFIGNKPKPKMVGQTLLDGVLDFGKKLKAVNGRSKCFVGETLACISGFGKV